MTALTQDTPTLWKCALDHTFTASYNMVEAGYTCPVCEAARLKNAIRAALSSLKKGPLPGRKTAEDILREAMKNDK